VMSQWHPQGFPMKAFDVLFCIDSSRQQHIPVNPTPPNIQSILGSASG